MNNGIKAIITDYELNDEEQMIKIYICLNAETEEVALLQPLRFPYNQKKELHNFFRSFPIFTDTGKIDLEWLVGSPAYVKLSGTKDSKEIIDIMYDYSCYLTDADEEYGDVIINCGGENEWKRKN